MQNFTLTNTDPGKRLLAVLKLKLADQWKTKEIRWLIEHNYCRVNGFVERFCSTRLRAGDRIELQLQKPPSFKIEKERILFEDDHLLIYDKPAAISSEQLADLLELTLVHRLDRDTTGVMVFAKTYKAEMSMEQLFRDGEVTKTYLAVVSPPPKGLKGKITLPLGKLKQREGAVTWGVVENGKKAHTEWVCLEKNKHEALLRVFPKTGRTHQIRIHLKEIGSPIIGDVDYGGRLQDKTNLQLHAEKISFFFDGEEKTFVSRSELC